MIILFLFFLNHCHSNIAVHFLEMFLLLVYFNLLLKFYVNLAIGYSFCRALRPVASGSNGTMRHIVAPLPGLRLLLGYSNYYAIRGSPYTSAHVLIENTLVQHKMAKNSHMALCCQNRVSKGTNQCYGLHDSASSSVHSASVTVLGLLKKKN